MQTNPPHFSVAIPTPRGQRYDATIPDTLDLAERAALAVNALTNLRPNDFYAVTQTFRFGVRPPTLGPPNWLTPKFLRALSLVRLASGSDLNLDIENEAWKAFLGRIHDDGLLYCPIGGDGPPPNTSYPMLNGVLAQALSIRAEIDGPDPWMESLNLLWKGLKRAMVDRGDYAYIPPECSLDSAGEWRWTLRGGGDAPGYLPYQPPEEPIHDSQGQEGAVKFDQASSIRALVQCFRMTGDEEALDLARKLVRFCMRPALWRRETDDDGIAPNEHGRFTGHFHGNVAFLDALLHFAQTDGDPNLMRIVREGYEHARQHGVIRLGFMPGWIEPLMGRDRHWSLHQNEGCGIADMLILAIRLSDAGLGDYWDDVDSMIRNHFAELQATDLNLMRRACGNETYDDVLRPFLGGFTQAEFLVNRHSSVFGCCTGNGSRALFHAWESVTRFRDGVASVNLFLNRASPWLDVQSYLPYEGRIVLVNKKASVIEVRIPGWLSPESLCCFIDDSSAAPSIAEGCARFCGLAPGQIVRIEFPVVESRKRYTIGDIEYDVRFRGADVVHVQQCDADRDDRKNLYAFFVRDHYERTQAAMRCREQFAAELSPEKFSRL